MLQFIYVWYSIDRFYKTDLPFIYIGSHKGYLNDSYVSSSKFFSIEMASDDMKWKRMIISKFDMNVSRSDINSIESKLIEKAFNRYGRHRCVNMSYNQFGNKHFNASGFSRLTNCNTGKIEWIPKHLKSFLLENGYSLTNGSTKNKICITNGKDNKFVQLDEVIEDGWYKGMTMKKPDNFSSIPKGYICVNKLGNHKFISIEEITKYVELGWNKGFSNHLKYRLKESSQKGKLRMTKNNKVKLIDSNLRDIYIENGWTKPSGTIQKGSICINNSVSNRYVHPDELEEYLSNDWHKGDIKTKKDSIPKGSICINNSVSNRYVHPDELEEYLSNDWHKGMINLKTNKGKKWINDNNTNRFISQNELEEYLSNGWQLGKLKNNK